ncbi:MAG TPA: hypothetical protein VGB73_06280 [Pyrinomonadaceae bacterium]|jgi:hypothetical protein
MNCQLFENVIDDLARGRMMDAGMRESGLAHAGSCRCCGARLEAERALAGALRALAAVDAESEAPERVEVALLSAFRQRGARKMAGQPDATLPSAEPSVTRAAAPASIRAFAGVENASAPRFVWNWSLRAAAAVVLVVFAAGLGVLFWRGSQPSEEAQQSTESVAVAPTVRQSNNSSVSAVSPLPDEATGESRLTQGAVAILQEASEATDEERGTTSVASVNNSRGQWRARQSPNPARFQEASATNGRRARGMQARNLSPSEESAEIATDFFPLGGAGAMLATEGGHVVRVELPRAAMASFGLPLNAEHTTERVKADVVIGDDGIARAIRFVR